MKLFETQDNKNTLLLRFVLSTDISGASFTVSKKRIPEVKLRVERFIQSMVDDFSTDHDDAVYQLNAQLFSLTK